MKKLLIVKQILLASTSGNVWRTLYGEYICILMFWCKGLTAVCLN